LLKVREQICNNNNRKPRESNFELTYLTI